MALVDDNQIEEFRVELAKYFFTVFPNKLLVEREIDLVSRIELSTYDLGCNPLERLEIAVYGLIDENIAVRQIENLTDLGSLSQAMNDLKSRKSLSRSRCHNEQDAILTSRNSFKRTIDGDALIVARMIAAVLLVIRSGHNLLAIRMLKPLSF